MVLNKSTLVIGSANTGKSQFIDKFLVDENLLRSDKIMFIDGRFNPATIDQWFFTKCDTTTQIIIVQNVLNLDVLYFFTSLITTGIMVHKNLYAPFKIHPKFILECSKQQFAESYFNNSLPDIMKRFYELVDIDPIVQQNAFTPYQFAK